MKYFVSNPYLYIRASFWFTWAFPFSNVCALTLPSPIQLFVLEYSVMYYRRIRITDSVRITDTIRDAVIVKVRDMVEGL